MSAKPCVACSKLIASSVEHCTYCGAAQPTEAAIMSKEARCATCKRPYASKLAECPFCERDRAAGIAPSAFGPTTSLSPPDFSAEEDEEDDPGPRTLGSAALFGVPLVVAAIWGLFQVLSADRLGGDGSAGPWRASLVLALFVASLLAIAFVRRSYRTLAGAVEEKGLTKVVVLGVASAILAFAPVSLGIAGLLTWINGLGADTRERTVDCKVGSIWQRLSKGTDMGWHVSYACDVDGEHLIGALERLPARPDYVEGGTMRFRAARGRLGYWVRLGEPIPPSAAQRAP